MPRQWLAIEPHESMHGARLTTATSITAPRPRPAAPIASHDHHEHHDPAHLHGISSFALTFDKELDGNGLSLGLQTMAAAYGDKLLRVKGIVTVAGQGKPFVVHGVQHVFYPPDTLKEWPKGADGTAGQALALRLHHQGPGTRRPWCKHLKPFIGEAERLMQSRQRHAIASSPPRSIRAATAASSRLQRSPA